MKLPELLRQIILSVPVQLDEDSERILIEIKTHADFHYHDQLFYGNAALNRKMLLDPYIAERLTPQVILCILTNDLNEKFQLRRDEHFISLADVLVFGLSQGLNVLKHMPNNEKQYNFASYLAQKDHYQHNTLKILNNIKLAWQTQQSLAVDKEQWLNAIAEQETLAIDPLCDRLDTVAQQISKLKAEGHSNALLYVPNYKAEDIRSQVPSGFLSLCQCIGINDLVEPIVINQESLEHFCERCLTHPEALLNGDVIHLFYDRVHLEAALEQDTLIEFSDGKKTYYDILKQMVILLDTNPQQYPSFVREQFCVRLLLVHQHLQSEHFLTALIPEPVFQNARPPTQEDELILQQRYDIMGEISDPSSFSYSKVEKASLSILEMYHKKFHIEHPELSTTIRSFIAEIRTNSLLSSQQRTLISAGLTLSLPPTIAWHPAAASRYRRALDEVKIINNTRVLMQLITVIQKKSEEIIEHEKYGSTLVRMNIASQKVKGFLEPLVQKQQLFKELKYQAEEALIKQTLWLLLNKLESSSRVSPPEEAVLHEADLSSTENEISIEKSTVSLKVIKQFLKIERLDHLCEYLQTQDENFFKILEEEITCSNDEMFTLDAIPRKITLATFCAEQKEKMEQEGVSISFGTLLQRMFEENKPYFRAAIAAFIHRPFSTISPINAAPMRENTNHTSYEAIQYILKHGQLSLVCQHLDEHFLIALEKNIKNSTVEFSIAPDTKIQLSEYYHAIKTSLQLKLKEHGIINEPPFGDILQAMYASEGPYYKKLNASLKNQSHFGPILAEEIELSFLLHAAQHKGGLDKARDEMQTIPSFLFRGDDFLGQSKILEEIHLKYNLFTRLKSYGFLKLDTTELRLLNLSSFFDKKMLSMTANIGKTETFTGDRGVLFYFENLSTIADFYGIENVAFNDENEFLSRLNDDLVLIPTHIYKKAGIMHVQLFAIRTPVLMDAQSLFTQRAQGLLSLITTEIEEAAVDSIQKARLNAFKNDIEYFIQQPEQFAEIQVENEKISFTTLLKNMKQLMSAEVISSNRKKQYDQINEATSLLLAAIAELNLMHDSTTPQQIALVELKNCLYHLEQWMRSLDTSSTELQPLDYRIAQLPSVLQQPFKVIFCDQASLYEKKSAAIIICSMLREDLSLSLQFSKLESVMQGLLSILDKIRVEKSSSAAAVIMEEEKTESPEQLLASEYRLFSSPYPSEIDREQQQPIIAHDGP